MCGYSFYFHYIDGGSADMDGEQRTGLMQTTMAFLEPGQCQACEAYVKETALLQRSLCVLRKKLEELYKQEKDATRREREAYNREQETQEQLCKALGREREVLCLLNEVKKENKFLHAALDTKPINFVQSMVGEPCSANQMNSMAPQTPSRPGQSQNTMKAHSPEDIAPLKIGSGEPLSVDRPSGTDLASTLTTPQKEVESTESMPPRTLSGAIQTDVGEPIEGDTCLLSGEADTQPGREVATNLIPGENKEQGQGQETEDVTMVECTVMETATDELHVLSATIGPSPNEVEMTSLDGRAKCLHEAPPVSTTLAEGLWATGSESVCMLTSYNPIDIGNLLKGDAGQVSGQVDAEVEEGVGTQLIHCEDKEQDQGHESNIVETGDRAVAGNTVDVSALSSDRWDVVEGSQHRKCKPVHMVLCSDDEDSPGTCPNVTEGYTLPCRKRKLFLSPTDDLGSPKTNARVGELGEGTSLQVPEPRIRKDYDMNHANYPGAATDSEPEGDVMFRTPGNLKRLNRLRKVHGSESEEESNEANRIQMRRSARLKHKISGNEDAPSTFFDSDEEISMNCSKGHSRARKFYGANEVEQDSRRRSARLNQSSANPRIVLESKKDLRRSRRVGKILEWHEVESDSDELVLETDGGQRSARLKQQSSRRRSIPVAEFARGCQDDEDEIESDEEDLDSFIADSDEVVSDSPEREDLSGATAASPTKQKRKKRKYSGPVNPSDSDSSGMLIGQLFRSARNKEPSSTVNNSCTSESSDDEKVVNLLRTENYDKEEEDEREDDSLSGFIVPESLHSEDSVSNGSNKESNSSSTGGSSVMGDTLYTRQVLLKRNQLDWEYEADMLAAMAKDSTLALQAVCALYRKQTEDEKQIKEAIYANKRGFDKFHAFRASNYAEFLTAGDVAGNPMKSVEELEQRFPGAVEFCHQIAAHHSKQLFEIYETDDDPVWRKRIS